MWFKRPATCETANTRPPRPHKTPAIIRSALLRQLRPALRQQRTACCSVTKQRPAAGLLSAIMGDAIDLTLSDSEDEAPPPQRKAKAPAAAAAAAARDAERQQEEAARKRIMDFAKSKAASNKRLKAAAADPQQETSAPPAPADATPAASDAAAAAGALPSANAQLRELHEARMRRQQQQQAAAGGEAVQPGPTSAAAAEAPAASSGSWLASQQRAPRQDAAAERGSRDISLLSYNVWFREDLAVLERMLAIGDIITNAGHPTFVCLQEVTPMILELFEQMPWWQQYNCCVPPPLAPYFTLLLVNRAAVPAGAGAASFKEEPFANSIMGRSLRSVRVEAAGHSLLVATSHLESPMPPHNWYSEPRQWQMRHSLEQLDAAGVGNVLFAGDMNWDEKRDGSPPLPPGWLDAWQALEAGRPGKQGFTYDTKSNGMLAFKGLQLRLDRIFCKLTDWRLKSVELVGTQALPGLLHTHRFRNGSTKQLPVLPSDHYGLLLRLEKAG